MPRSEAGVACRGWIAAVVAVAIGLATPSIAAAAPPTVSFTVQPAAPQTGELVTFTATATDPDGDALTYAWRTSTGETLAGADTATATTTFATSGQRVVTVTVTDATDASTEQSETVTVGEPPQANELPVAAFTMDRTTVRTGTTVNFASTSTDADGTVAAHAWDLDGDGRFDDGTRVTARRTYRSAGVVDVRLQVTDDRGATAVAAGRLVVVANARPVAAFSYKPVAPRVGDAVLFTSTSFDPDGSIARWRWDLDGDGAFDDGTAPLAAWAFGLARSNLVALRVTDDTGATVTAFDTVQVSPAAVTPPALGGLVAPPALGAASPTSAARASVRARLLLSPFPIVRMRGVIRRGAVLVQVLSVRASRGTRIEVTCAGRSCPARRVVRVVRGPLRVVRIRTFERLLRPGAVIEVRVTRRGRIGKYTRFRIRAGAAPLRRDLCMRFGARRPSACPVQ